MVKDHAEPGVHNDRHDLTSDSPSLDDTHTNTNTQIDLERGQSEASRPNITHVTSHVSHHDMQPTAEHVEANAEQFLRFSPRKKIIMTAVLSLCGFLSPLSSTSILAAIPEVAAEYDTTGDIINVSNALYMVFMGLSPCFWGPLSQIYGRRWICLVTGFLFTAFSVGTALAPNLASYFIFRLLTALQGTSFLIVGSACLGDIYTPTARATAMGWFFSGTLVGPAFGPFIGGIIVTFRPWRVIFWLQTALGGLATILVFFILPETIPHKRIEEFEGQSRMEKARSIAHLASPFRIIILLFQYPNLITVAFASSSLVWNMYSLLTPIRYVINPRFHLTTPIESGLFYIAPGCGYLLGTFFGGRWADRTVQKWIRKRNGQRVPEDRLRSCLPFLGVVIPACMLIYGWSIYKKVGGIPLPVICMFIQGVSQLFCFPSLNTYLLDAGEGKARSAEVVAGNYMVRYFMGAIASAVVLPAINGIGVGWFSTISAGFLVAAAGLVFLTAKKGRSWANEVEEKKRLKKEKRSEKANAAHSAERVDVEDESIDRSRSASSAVLAEKGPSSEPQAAANGPIAASSIEPTIAGENRAEKV